MLDKITVLHFSPTGGTRKAALSLARLLAKEVQEADLCDRAAEPRAFSTDDLVLIAGPVYGGRLPGLMRSRLEAFTGNGAEAITAAVYGNRAFEDALLELNDAAQALGFRVLASAALVAEHSMLRSVAAGRPDAEDARQMGEFAKGILGKLETEDDSLPQAVPGGRPYKDWKQMAAVPLASSECTSCGLCAETCPAGAISPDAPGKTDPAKCILCMRCVAVCPNRARALPGQAAAGLAQMLSPLIPVRSENRLYL